MDKHKKTKTAVALSVTLLALTACTSDGTPLTADPSPTDIPELEGFFDLDERIIGDQSELSIRAGFTDNNGGVAFITAGREEKCFYNSADDSFYTDESGDIGRAIPPQGIEAGTLILNNTNGPIATLSNPIVSYYDQYVQEGIVVATTETSGLTLDITGGVYPAMSQVPVSDMDPLTDLSPALEIPLASTVITWTPAANTTPDTNIELNLRLRDSSGGTYFCRVFDDGEVDLGMKRHELVKT